MFYRYYWSLLLPALLLPAGCARPQAQAGMGAPPPPEVKVSLPVSREVTDFEDFPGRTEAVNSIDVRARATGYLATVNFREGSIVQKDVVLFEIDSKPYEAELARAEANLVQAEAHAKRLDLDYKRGLNLIGTKAMAQEDFDKISGDRAEAIAAISVASASRDTAKLNLGYTKVHAPITGRISRRNIDPGNLVKADDTILTTIVSLDPIYAYFDVDERATLRLKQLVREGKLKFDPENKVPVFMALANEKDYPHKGIIDFVDNRVDADTGTWRLRGKFDNPNESVASGMFVHVRLPIGPAHQALMIAEEALGTDQGQRFVYVIDDEGKAHSRPVTVGRLHEGLRVILDGLKPADKIVVNGLQRVRPEMVVKAEVITMPGSSH